MSIKISFIGFGEAAQTFSGSPAWMGKACAYDLKLRKPEQSESMMACHQARNISARNTNAAAVNGASLILSLVTADQALEAARETAENLSDNALFLDMNSISPDKKQAAARLIEDAGGVYVDVSIMAPVQPAALDVPLLVSGRDAERAKTHLRSIGFSNVRAVGHQVGEASAIKMIRSVMIKGMEALTAECLIAAETAGVTRDVLDSLGGDFATKADYNLDRMLNHGARRAAEMEEVCATLESLGVDPAMSRGTVRRQRELGVIGEMSVPNSIEDKLRIITQTRRVDAA